VTANVASIPAGLFRNTPAVKTIFLAKLPRLRELPAGLLDATSALEVLQLNDNNLTTIPAGFFDKAKGLKALCVEGVDGQRMGGVECSYWHHALAAFLGAWR
jgi:hypothetical protein